MCPDLFSEEAPRGSILESDQLVFAFWEVAYRRFDCIWFGFLCAQISYGNCETMESWKIRNLVPKALESCENFGNQTWVIKECGKTRKELGPKRVPQLFLGSLQGTRRSTIG